MYRNLTFLFVFILGILTSINGQKVLVTFASDINGQNDPGKYDLFIVKYDIQSNEATELQQLTDTENATEFFPSLSEDKKWIAFNYQKDWRNEVRLVELESQNEFSIFENGRFPEWISPDELLVAKVTGNEQDIYKLTLDLSGETPVVLSSERIADRTNCPDTGKTSDPYPMRTTGRVLFHALRPNQSGAALATINLDGTNYRRLTDWNGSGHGISTDDGRIILCTRSQNGRPYLLDVSDDEVIARLLDLPNSTSELRQYDERYAQTPFVSFSYPAWGNDSLSVFYTLKGRSNGSDIEVARLLYVAFDDNYESGEIVDFSSAVETLTGSSGHNFSTASSRIIETPQTDNVSKTDIKILPNPFYTSTTIKLVLDQPTQVSIDIFDVSGSLIKQLINEKLDAGSQSIQWDGTHGNGSPVSSGMYYIVLKKNNIRSVLPIIRIGKE